MNLESSSDYDEDSSTSTALSGHEGGRRLERIMLESSTQQTLDESEMMGFHPRSHKNDHGSDSRQFSASVGISI